jgi:hypothetical protein
LTIITGSFTKPIKITTCGSFPARGITKIDTPAPPEPINYTGKVVRWNNQGVPGNVV